MANTWSLLQLTEYAPHWFTETPTFNKDSPGYHTEMKNRVDLTIILHPDNPQSDSKLTPRKIHSKGTINPFCKSLRQDGWVDHYPPLDGEQF